MGERDSAPSRGSGGQGREEWLQLVVRSAGSNDPKGKRILPTADGVEVPPLCASASPREAADYPGCPPRRRGASAAQGINGWDIRPQRAELDPEAVNTAILEDLEQGATSIALCLDTALARGSALPEATVAYDLPALDRALRDVPIDLVLVALESGERFAEGAALLLVLAEHRGVAATDLQARLGADPLGCLARGARLDPDAALASADDLSSYTRQRWPLV